MTLSIRPALVSDAYEIAAIHVSSWQAAYRNQMPDSLLDSLSISERAKRRKQHLETPLNPEIRTWVILKSGTVLGFSVTGPAREKKQKNIAELYAIYLCPRFFRKGYGRVLLDHCIKDLKKRDFSQVVLWVLDTNIASRKFYESSGFFWNGIEKWVNFGGKELRELEYEYKISMGKK